MTNIYADQAAVAAKRILELESTNDGWKKVKETQDCVVHSRPSDDFQGHNLYKCEGKLPASPETVFSFAYPGVENPKRLEWDTAITSATVHERPSPDMAVIVSRTAAVCKGLISAREFVDVVKVTREPTRIWTAAVSVTHPDVGESKGVIRGFNHPSSLLCYRTEGDPNETRFVQYVHSDLRGMLPQSLVESAIPAALVDTHARLKAALEKNTGNGA